MASMPKRRMIGSMEKRKGREADPATAPELPPGSHLDDLLDAALADTFPASDPVSRLTSSAPVRRPAGDERQ